MSVEATLERVMRLINLTLKEEPTEAIREIRQAQAAEKTPAESCLGEYCLWLFQVLDTCAEIKSAVSAEIAALEEP